MLDSFSKRMMGSDYSGNLLAFTNSPQKKAIHWTERRAPGIRNLVSASLHIPLKEVVLNLISGWQRRKGTNPFSRREENEN